jgi:hypothetical protein
MWVVELRGFEPLTPCMPSMLEWFTTPCSTSPTNATAQVRGAVEGWVVPRREATCSAVSGKSLARDPCMVVRAAASNLGMSRTNSTCCRLLSPRFRSAAAPMRPAACGHGFPAALSGAAIPDPQSKAAAQPDGGRLASHTARRRPARAVAQVNAFPLTRRGQPVLQREDQPVGGMKMCTLLIGSNQAVAAPPGAMILRTPFSTMVTP